jgi:hypothetical protein
MLVKQLQENPLRTALFAALILTLAGCATSPARPPANWPTTPAQRIDPPAVVEASCPSPLLFDREPIGGWKGLYEACRGTVFSLTK